LKIPREKLYLQNRNLERNPDKHKEVSGIYKQVKDHIKKTGYIINPLLVVEDGEKYKVVYGNNRYLAGVELGLKEFPIQILPDPKPETIREAAKSYKKVDLDGDS